MWLVTRLLITSYDVGVVSDKHLLDVGLLVWNVVMNDLEGVLC